MPPKPFPVPALLPAGEQTAQLAHLLEGLDQASLWWLSGYAAGLARAGAAPANAAPAGAPGQTQPAAPGPVGVASVTAVPAPTVPAPAAQALAPPRLTVLYGSQTGNARRHAERVARRAEAEGLAVRLVRTDAYATRELKDERLLLVVISTQGEGDPPDDAIGFVEFLEGRRAPALKELRYGVLGLGDSSYPQFCAIGRRIDARLAELGAQRLLPAGEADVDIETVAGPWEAEALARSKEAAEAAGGATSVTPLRPAPAAAATPPAAAFDRDNPFPAEILVNQRLTAGDSDKDVRHLELSLEGSGLSYRPGDALGIWAPSPAALVDGVLALLGLDGEAAVAHGGHTRPLREWLREHRELTRLARPFLAAHAERAGADELRQLLTAERATDFAALLASHQLVDVLRRWPARWEPEALVATLRPLTPRMYSIASAQQAVGEEVHLTVDVVGHGDAEPLRLGTASHHLAGLAEGAAARVFIEPNERFRLPADPARDVIMIGPGTGVAPFRAFLQERADAGAGGRHWLFFGARTMRRDFLYQTEWQDLLRRGRLQRLDLAFSRDGADKVYVQDRLRERGAELYAWLQGGAHLYVCGAIAMGRDVHEALLDILATHGEGGREGAADYLADLQKQGRYARDVY